MQMALAIDALQARRHRQPQEGKGHPKTQVLNSEPGAPFASRYFPETYPSGILSSLPMSTNFHLPDLGHPRSP